MLYLVCYDIENDRLRQRLAEKLLKMGLERVQYSVFVGPLSNEQRDILEGLVNKWFTGLRGCGFLLIPLHQYSTDNATHIGFEPLDWEYLTGEKLVLIV